ncbi:MAG: hypothetical protein DWI22_15455 [Planctomycetota bacterium]|jgi:hypothetical protein|nr:hypothetical protein [Planctomycetales bacterium]RLT04722.1 MAG: hypothetical protein DWI22_15455 [Planctomycetota bacterium]
MDGVIEIPVPDDIENHDEKSLIRYFQDQLENIGGRVSEALDLTCDQADRQAILERVRMTRVSIAGDSIELAYLVEISKFEACKGVLDDYTFSRKIMGQQVAGVWRFEKQIPAPERSTHDEL